MSAPAPLDKAAVLRAWDALGYGYGAVIADIFETSQARVSWIVSERDLGSEEMRARARCKPRPSVPTRQSSPAAQPRRSPVKRTRYYGVYPVVDKDAVIKAYEAMGGKFGAGAAVAQRFGVTRAYVSQIICEHRGGPVSPNMIRRG